MAIRGETLKLRLLILAATAANLVITAPCLSAESTLQDSLIDRPAVGDLGFWTTAGKHLIAAPELPGKSALSIEVPAPPAGSHVWDIGVGAATTADINKGDRILVALWARAASGSGDIGARMQESAAPYGGIAQADIHLTSAWQLFQFQGVAGQDYPAGHASISLTLNTRQQALDIGPVYVFRNPSLSAPLQRQILAIPLSGARDAVIETPEGLKLAATLRTPPGDGPFPAVLMVTGSGPWSRNPSDPVSLSLLSGGNAVLQFDKRGVGQSSGKFENGQTADLARDADVIAKWLRHQPEINSRHTGILGISEGGMIAVLVAANDPDVSFVVDMAGPAEPLAELGIRQNELAWLDAGSPPDQVAAWVKMEHDILAAVRAATSDDDAAARVRAALAPYVGSLINQATVDATAEHFRNAASRAQFLYDPKDELARIRVPVLGIFGTMDHQVPAEENAAALRKGLTAAKDVTIVILPGLNHLFQHAKTGSVAEWQTLTEPQESDPGLNKLIADWVVAHTK